MRSWQAQQRQLGHKAELDELTNLLKEIVTKSANRHDSMRRLIGSCAPNSRADMEECLREYRKQVVIWNSSLNSMYIRLRLMLGYGYTLKFEKDIHNVFRITGERIEYLVIKIRGKGVPDWSELDIPKDMLNKLQGNLANILNDIGERIEKRKSEIFFGERLYYTKLNISKYNILNYGDTCNNPQITHAFATLPPA